MTTEALVPADTVPAVATGGAGEVVLPQVIVDAGPQATARFLEFFAGRIANARTRAAYGRAVGQFLGWCEARGLGLRDVSPLHVAAYIRTHPGSAVKQHLAADGPGARAAARAGDDQAARRGRGAAAWARRGRSRSADLAATGHDVATAARGGWRPRRVLVEDETRGTGTGRVTTGTLRRLTGCPVIGPNRVSGTVE